jgi:regulator of replication initiation timing
MFNADGKKLSIAERNYAYRIIELEEELKTAEAAHHWVVIERDKLRVENTKLRQQLKHERKTGFADGQLNAEIKFAGVRELAQAVVDARNHHRSFGLCPTILAKPIGALAKALGD